MLDDGVWRFGGAAAARRGVADGQPAAGPETAGPETAGPETAGLETAGPETAGGAAAQRAPAPAAPKRLLPEGWTAFVSEPTPSSRGLYGAGFWLGGRGALRDEPGADACDALFPSRVKPDRCWWYDALPEGTFAAHGFESQMVAVVPSKRLVVVRLGATKEVVLSWDRTAFYSELVGAFPS
jgi:CubicO group peptidase (beta-lactamase class C family)